MIVLLAGTNNIGTSPASNAKVSAITKGIKALLDMLHQKSPRATIVVMGILTSQRRGDWKAVMASIHKINETITKFENGKTIRYLNINEKLANKDGLLFDGMTEDRLHLDLQGYQVWADAR